MPKYMANASFYRPKFGTIDLLTNRRATFVERNDVSESVVSAFENDLPFAEITIPASGNVIKALLAACWSKLYFISISSFLTYFITAQVICSGPPLSPK